MKENGNQGKCTDRGSSLRAMEIECKEFGSMENFKRKVADSCENNE